MVQAIHESNFGLGTRTQIGMDPVAHCPSPRARDRPPPPYYYSGAMFKSAIKYQILVFENLLPLEMSERSPTKHVLRMQIRIRGHIPDCTRHIANSVSVGAIVINIFLSP